MLPTANCPSSSYCQHHDMTWASMIHGGEECQLPGPATSFRLHLSLALTYTLARLCCRVFDTLSPCCPDMAIILIIGITGVTGIIGITGPLHNACCGSTGVLRKRSDNSITFCFVHTQTLSVYLDLGMGRYNAETASFENAQLLVHPTVRT